MIGVSVPSQRDIVDKFQGDSRTHRKGFLHPTEKILPVFLMREEVPEGNMMPFGKGFEAHNNVVSQYPLAVVHLHDRLVAFDLLGQDCSYEQKLSASHARRKQRDLIKSRGKLTARLIVQMRSVSSKEAFEHR